MSIEAMRNAVEAMDKHDFEMADHILCQAIAEAEKQEQGEPVAITTGTYGGRFTYVTNKPNVILPNGMALFASPQQRTWVGLTDEDKKQIAKEANYNWEMTTGEYAERIGRLTESKLREKNT